MMANGMAPQDARGGPTWTVAAPILRPYGARAGRPRTKIVVKVRAAGDRDAIQGTHVLTTPKQTKMRQDRYADGIDYSVMAITSAEAEGRQSPTPITGA
jgi:hypothetical protein